MNQNKNYDHVGLKYWDRNVKSIERKIFFRRTLCKVEKKLKRFLSQSIVDRCMKQLSSQSRVKLRRMHIPGLKCYKRSSKCKSNTTSSKVSPTAAVESSCQFNNKRRLSSQLDNPPELLAEEVGWRLNSPLQTKKSVIKFNKISEISERKKQVPKECLISSTTQIEDIYDEYKELNESINSTLKKLKTPKKISNNISAVSPLRKEIMSENITISSESLYQTSIKEIIPTISQSQTRIGSSKSPRISRVIATAAPNHTNETTEQSSRSSTPDKRTEKSRKEIQCELTKHLSMKLARVRANFKSESKRKLQTKSKIRNQTYLKRRKCEVKLDMSFLSDTDQESDITASKMDKDKSENDVTNMNESLAKVESEEGSIFSVLSRSNVEKDKQRIPFISSPTHEVEHCEESMIIDAKVASESQIKDPDSIDLGISGFEASPVRPSWPIEANELSKEIDNDQQIKNHKILDEFICTVPKLSDNAMMNSNVSLKISYKSITDPLRSEEENEKNLENSSARVDAVLISKSINAKLLSNQTPLSNNTSSLIEKDNCNKNKDKNCDVVRKTMTQKEVIDTKLLTIIDGDSKSKFNGNSSEITSISTPDTTENILLNQKETKEIAAMINVHLKKHESAQITETFQQKDEIILNQTVLPLKKRPRTIVTSSTTGDLMQKTITKDVSMGELPLASSSQTDNSGLMNPSTIITTVRQSIVGEALSTRNNEINDEFDTNGTKDSQKLNLNNTDKLNDTIDQSSTGTNNTDNKKRSESLQSSTSTPMCAFKPLELGPKWHCVTPAVANGNVFKVPLTQNLYSAPVLQVLSSPSVSHQPQSPASSQVPMQVQLQIQPSIPNQFQSQLFLNLTTTSEQSNPIVADNFIPSLVQYPIGILSHVQQINKPQVTSNNSTIPSNPKLISSTVSENMNNPGIPEPSSSMSLPLLTPKTFAYVKSESLLFTSSSRTSSTSATVKSSESLPSTCSLPVSSISVPLSSLNQPSHTSSSQIELPLNNRKIINQQLNSLPILECNVNNPAQVNSTEQNITVYLNFIIVNMLEVRKCLYSLLDMKKTINQPETLTSQQSLRVRYSSLINHIISSYLTLMTIVRKFHRHITIYDMFNYTVTYSAKIGSAVPPITLQEINNIYLDYVRKQFQQSARNNNQNAQINSQLLNNQIQNGTTVSYAYNHQMLSPYPNANNSFPQNLPRMQSPQPVPPPTITYGYPGMTGEMQTLLNRTDPPMPVPPPVPPAVPKTQKSRACPPVKRSLLSTAQNRTFTMQMSAYRKINRWLAVEMDKIRNVALYNHTLRQLQQQDALALQQQRRNQQQAQSHSSNSRVSRGPRIVSKHQQPKINNQNPDAAPCEQNDKSSRSPPQLQLVQLNPSDKNTNNNTGAIAMQQALEQLLTIPLTDSNFSKSTRKTPLKQKHNNALIIESSTTPNTVLRNDESEQNKIQQGSSADKSSTTVTTTTEDQIDNSTESTSIKSEDLLGLSTVELQSMPGILAAANSSSQVDEPWNLSPSILFRANKHQQSIMNSVENINVNCDEQNSFIVAECLEENQIKIEPYIETQEHTVDIKEETIKMELSLLSEMKTEKECYGTKNDSYDSTATVSTAMVHTESCAIPNIKTENNLPEHVDKIKESILNDGSQKTTINNKNNQIKSCVPELIDLNDSSDDDIDCISILSSDRETIIISRDTETRNRIEYNQSSIDEELECEALSKKLGIRCPPNNQDCSYMKTEVPIITDVMTIDKNTYDNLDKAKKNLLINDNIIDITDMSLKFENNIASPGNTNFETTVFDFNGESIEGLEHRPNCANCSNKKGTVVCECGEVSYCSDRCLEAHWPESHANICSGPTINIVSIAEITLDDD